MVENINRYFVEISADELRVLYGYAGEHIEAMSKSTRFGAPRRITAELLFDAVSDTRLVTDKSYNGSRTICAVRFEDYVDDPWLTELNNFATAITRSTDPTAFDAWVLEFRAMQASYGLFGETKEASEALNEAARKQLDLNIKAETEQHDYYLRRLALSFLLGHGAVAATIASALLTASINQTPGIWLLRASVVGLILAALHPVFLSAYQSKLAELLNFERQRLSFPREVRAPPRAFDLKQRTRALNEIMAVSAVLLISNLVAIAVFGPALLKSE